MSCAFRKAIALALALGLVGFSFASALGQQALFPGLVKREVFKDIPGTALLGLTDSQKFKANRPDEVSFETSFEAPSDIADNYGQRMSGLLLPPEDGQYVFFINSDDQSQLFLSTDDNPGNRVLICSEPVWNGSRAWQSTERRTLAIPENRSSAVELRKGNRYYIEALHKEGGGGDNLAVTWKKVAEPNPENGSAPIGSAFLAVLADTSVAITQQPANATVLAGKRARFTVGANATPGLTYQWQQNGTPIAGATNASYLTSPTTLSDSGAIFAVTLANATSSLISSNAILSVTPFEIFIPCFLKFEVYSNIQTGPLLHLIDNPRYPDLPDDTRYLTAFNTRTVYPDDSHENYAARISGFITPIETGDYDFFLRSDDASQLYLSKIPDNLDPLALELIAEETGCCNSFLEPGAPQTTAKPIPLEAGKTYFVRAIYKEGASSDYCQVAWRKVGDPTKAFFLKPIPSAFLGMLVLPGGDITITRQPVDAVALNYDTATFTVAADGSPAPLCIQWLKNGVPIPGANGTSYTTPRLKFWETHAKISAQISVPGKVVLSEEVTLIVINEPTKPIIVSVSGSETFINVTVAYDEPVAASAEDPANYSLDGGLTISGITRIDDFTVKLITSRQISGTKYTLTVNGVKDTESPVGNVILPNSKTTFTAWILSRSGALHSFYESIAPNNLDALKNDPRFKADNPTWRSYVKEFEWPPDAGNKGGSNYGNQIRALLVPPVTGDYIFYVASDDNSEVYLSADEDPANKTLICAEPTWIGVRVYRNFRGPGPDPPENVSSPIPLVAGKSYYLEAIHTEGGGGDNLAVTWQLPGALEIQNGDPPISGRYLATYVNPDDVHLEILNQPQSQTGTAGATASFTVRGLTRTNTVFYQWQKAMPGSTTFTNIPDATEPRYTTPTLTLADSGTRYQVNVFVLGAETNSQQAELTVVVDTFPPEIVSVDALKKGDAVEIGVLFNEAVDPASTSALTNYSLDSGVITAVRFVPENGVVVLTATGLTPAATYTLTVKNVKDHFNNIITTSISKTFRATSNLSWAAVGGNELHFPQIAVAVAQNGFDVISGGVQYWATYDESTFVYEEITGDFDKKVQVESQDFSSYGARAGLMAREHLDADAARDSIPFSRYQHVHVNPVRKFDGSPANNSHETHRRLQAGGQTTTGLRGGAPQYPNAWVRLARLGDTFKMYRSDDGMSWISLGEQRWPANPGDPPMPARLFVGPNFAPELGNIPEDSGKRKAMLARFRDYGDTSPGDPPGCQLIQIHREGMRVVLEWNGLCGLQSADQIDGPWHDVTGALSPRTVIPSEGAKFYRLRQ